jgi:hypothetical protein
VRALTPIAIVATVVLAAAPIAWAGGEARDALVVVESGQVYRLSVPVSRLELSLPKGGLVPVPPDGRDGARASPRYFHFNDATHGINLSGWFEPAQSYHGLDALWKGDTGAWKQQGQPQPRNVSVVKRGDWEAVLYDLDLGEVSNTHVRAEWVQFGTWIDVHISVTTREPIADARKTALAVLESLSITQAR